MEKKMQFAAETSKVLQLMIHSLYTNKDIFLRELISNASDACDKLRYQALTNTDMLGSDNELAISLILDAATGTLTIVDNGIGMNETDMIANLGTIARSGTQDFLAQLSGDGKKDMPLIGQFGVGFYSAFMVADKVVVKSRKAGEAVGYEWSSDGLGEFTISELEETPPRGTSITLHLKKGDEQYLDKFKVKFIAQTYSDHISFPIHLLDGDGEKQVLNQGAALWARQKSSITPEQYKEFYHHVSHSPDDPWMVLHNKAEGKIEYTNLLFIPSMRPFDLFHPDRKRRVKLYVKRVFITDEGVDIIPQYLRFLRGIIDSEDLPLNISRETLQHNPMLDKIRDAVVKRVLSDLKKKAESDPDTYATFWELFGPVLKEGLCEAIAPKESILETSRFHSSNGEKLVSMDDYISRMQEGQEYIYYLTGDRLESLRKNPKIEGFKKRNIEVLLFTDHVDDFWVNVVQEYKGKKLRSVTRSGSELDAVAVDGEPATPQESSADMNLLMQKLQTVLDGQVKEVRLTRKLADSPVCLAVGEMDMDIRMEKFLVENKQLPGASARILELNPDHPIILSLAQKAAAEEGEESLKEVAFLLLDQARILEGEEVTDPAAFMRRMNYYVQKSLAA